MEVLSLLFPNSFLIVIAANRKKIHDIGFLGIFINYIEKFILYTISYYLYFRFFLPYLSQYPKNSYFRFNITSVLPSI